MSQSGPVFGFDPADEDTILYLTIAFLGVVLLLLLAVILGMCYVNKKLKQKEEERIARFEEDYIRRFGLPLPNALAESTNSIAKSYWRDDWDVPDYDPTTSRSRMYADFIIEDAERMVPLPRAYAPDKATKTKPNSRYSYDNIVGQRTNQTTL